MTAKVSTSEIEKIGRYRVTGEIGRGGMGVVYQGEDRLIGRRVAIKTLTEVTPELRERFYIEAKSGILSHPNIVTVYEVGEHEGNPFIAMEFVEGDSLEHMLRLRKRLPLLEAISIVEQLCAGLGHAHEHGVLHRDIKPANILVRPDGRVTIVDFGIARLADQTRQLTKTNTLLGTFHYISPERLKGEASDGRADIWSVGVILYEMLTGELPFKGGDISSLYRVIHEPFVPLEEHIQDLPDGVNRVFDKALAKQVEMRYATAEEMAIDLRALAEGLKHDRVGALLETAQRLTDENQYASARTVLMQVQRIDPGNSETKTLLGNVQDRLTDMHRSEQLRQIVEQAQDAANGRRWNEAVTLLEKAQKLDAEDTFHLDERLKYAQTQKIQQQQVLALWKQADEARNLGDLTKAQDCLDQALQIDERNTELRNAYSDLLREAKRRQQQLRVEELVHEARVDNSKQRYTEAISRLREAVEIDPDRQEVQELLFSVTARQKEERQKNLREQAGSNVREALDREDFASADDHVTRALEILPGDQSLLGLKSQIEEQKREAGIQETVRKAVLEAQQLFVDHPEQALQVIEQGLKEAPDSDTLIQFRTRLLDHLKDIQKSANRPQRDEAAAAFRKKTQSNEELQDTQELLKTVPFVQVPASLEQSVPANSVAEAAMLLEKPSQNQGQDNGQSESTAKFTEVFQVLPRKVTPALQEQAKDARAKEEEEAAKAKAAAERQPMEIRAAVDKAVTACDKAIAAGRLDSCMRPLEDLAKQHGESAVFTAKQTCESRREQRATKIVRDAIQVAQRQLRSHSAKKADRALRDAESALPFARAQVRSEWQQLQQECMAAQSAKVSSPDKRSKVKWYAAGSIAVIAALGIAGLFYWQHETSSPQNTITVSPPAPKSHDLASAGAPTDIEINASPWAKIVSIQDQVGKNIALPEGDQTTPLRLEGVNSGVYKVTFAGTDNKQQTVECNVSANEHLCAADMGVPDTAQVLKGRQP